MKSRIILSTALAITLSFSCSPAGSETKASRLPLGEIRLPPGFAIEVYIGYRVMMVRLEGNKAVSYEPFAQGWLRKNGKAWGRPADVLVMPDGALLVSDDEAGVIYRITYRKA